jgi:two-component system KDP operon response regulator KdpE
LLNRSESRTGGDSIKEKILVIDDDAEFLGLTQTWLQNAGYEVLTAEDGSVGLRRVYSSRPKLVLLDVNMPETNGWEVCRRIREMSDIAIIMITVNRQKDDILRGFGVGADDYVMKPVDFPELLARVGAVLRRCQGIIEDDDPGVFHQGEITVDWKSHQVYVREQLVKLSPTEFRLLSCLIKNRGWVATHEQLLRKAWGSNYVGDRSFVKLYIRYLRQKLEMDPHHPKLIVTERGIGYRFVVESN